MVPFRSQVQFVFVLLVGAALAQTPVPPLPVPRGPLPPLTHSGQHTPILQKTFDRGPDGSYHFNYASADGSTREETGVITNPGTEVQAHAVQGSYSYISPDGTPVNVNYVADENGYRASGNIINPSVGGGAGRLPFTPQSSLLNPSNPFFNPQIPQGVRLAQANRIAEAARFSEAARLGAINPEAARLNGLTLEQARQAILSHHGARDAGFPSIESARRALLNPQAVGLPFGPAGLATNYINPEAARLNGLTPEQARQAILSHQGARDAGFPSIESARRALLNPQAVGLPFAPSGLATNYINPEAARLNGLTPEQARLAILTPVGARNAGFPTVEAARVALLHHNASPLGLVSSDAAARLANGYISPEAARLAGFPSVDAARRALFNPTLAQAAGYPTTEAVRAALINSYNPNALRSGYPYSDPFYNPYNRYNNYNAYNAYNLYNPYANRGYNANAIPIATTPAPKGGY